MTGSKIRMQTFQGKYWAILVETDRGERFASDVTFPVTQEFSVVLCDTEQHANMVAQMEKTHPRGKYRVVPVVVTVEEVEKHETPKAVSAASDN